MDVTMKASVSDNTSTFEVSSNQNNEKLDEVSNVIIKKGYSPFVGPENTWFEYDPDIKAFVDTGVKATGDPGYTPVKGLDYFTAEEILQFKKEVTPRKDVDYTDGKDGRTPEKGLDYFTEEEIADFKKAVTPVKNKDYFDGEPGYTPVKNKDYFDGYTPQKSIDYFTEEEINSIEQSVKDGIQPQIDKCVKDIQVDGSSIITDGIANIPVAQNNARVPEAGLVRVSNLNYGIALRQVDGVGGILTVKSASDWSITNGRAESAPLFMSQFDKTLKAAMCDGKGAVWTEDEQAASRARMGAVSYGDVTDMLNALDTPILSKTYEDIRYSATSIYNGTYPYVKFGEIKPIDLDRPCSIVLRLKVEVNNTDGSLPIAVYGEYLVKLHFAQDVVSTTSLIPRYKYLAFETYSKFPSASYRPIYTFCTRGLNNKGFVAENTIPFGWVRGSTDYKYNVCTRNITIDVMECINCTATLVDEIAHANANGFIGDGVTGNYDGITSFSDLGTIGDRHTGDYNVDTYNRLNDNANKEIADLPVYRYDLLLEKLDGTFAPLRSNNKSGSTTNGGIAVPNITSAFKIGGRILYYATTGTLAVGAFTGYGDVEYTGDGRYLSTNAAGNAMKIDGEPLTATNARALYLKVKDNGDLTFSLDSNLPADLGYHFTQSLPTSNDGYLYIQIGRMTNHLYQYRLTAEHDIYYHDGERLRRY